MTPDGDGGETGKSGESDLALVLTGGGARGAYQVGFLRHLARCHPELGLPILTGVSAGAVNAVQLASRRASLADKVEALTRSWCSLSVDQVFRVDSSSLSFKAIRVFLQLGLLGGRRHIPQTQGIVDTEPLQRFLHGALESRDGRLPGIQQNLDEGILKALAVTTTDYTTGCTVTWCQGQEVSAWERPKRKSTLAEIGVEHVMASTALPLFFPAVQLDGRWFGDGGIRLHAPLAPATHLGAEKILAVSTRHTGEVPAAQIQTTEYPPPAQIMGVLFNSIFLDLVDEDALRMQRVNELLARAPSPDPGTLRPVELLVLRPSQDLGELASAYEPQLPGLFRFLTRRLGTREAGGHDFLSMVMFQGDYLHRIIELGEADANARKDEIAAFLGA